MRRLIHFTLTLLPAITLAQFPGQWGQGPPAGGRPNSAKPLRPSPYSRPVSSYGKPVIPPQVITDDPIPANQNLDNSYESQQLPSKLPLQAPNGVVEIYNRVVDDLIQKLEVSFRKRDIDPMNVIIRPTPPTPVRVPGHLQKRPFRRPGAPLYRSTIPGSTPVRMKNARSESFPAEGSIQVESEKPSFRGAGKISKGPLGEEKLNTTQETTPLTVVLTSEVESAGVDVSSTPKVAVVVENDGSMESSEEPNLFRSRSDEYFVEDEDAEEVESKGETKTTKSRSSIAEKKTKKEAVKDDSDEDEDDLKAIEEGQKDVDKLIQRYQNKNVNEIKEKGKNKYSTGSGKKKESDSNSSTIKKKVDSLKKKEADEVREEDEDDEDDVNDDLDEGPQSGHNFYQGGPMQQKPNAQLTGLSKIQRASDVAVNVDSRSAIITARLLVGPLHVNINDSIEPMERSVRATIPELEAELILMERHGVVFLQRFTLDRAYGQDVEISMPKVKSDGKTKKSPSVQGQGQGPIGMDPNHPQAQQRFQTKMAAHISMEVVKLLRSGNLRVNMMRTAQGSMSKLKLPIKSNKNNTKKKMTKEEGKKNSNKKAN